MAQNRDAAARIDAYLGDGEYWEGQALGLVDVDDIPPAQKALVYATVANGQRTMAVYHALALIHDRLGSIEQKLATGTRVKLPDGMTDAISFLATDVGELAKALKNR